jgi:hypothetical protein
MTFSNIQASRQTILSLRFYHHAAKRAPVSA